MPKKNSCEEELKSKDKELQDLKKDNLALLKSALKQSQINKQLKEGIDTLVEVNKKLNEKVKKDESRKKSRS